MSSRKLSDLSPYMQDRAILMLKWCKAANIDYLIYCTWRSPEEQAYLYRIGRELPGKIVTNAKAGESKHNYEDVPGLPSSEAWDGVPLINGKPLWSLYIMDTTNRRVIHPIWEKVVKIGHGLGLKSGMDFKGKLREAPHWENPNA